MKTGLSQSQAEILYGLDAVGLELAAMKYLVKSPQLRAQMRIAEKSGEPLNLVVSSRTLSVSEPLVLNVRATGGIVFVYNPATDA